MIGNIWSNGEAQRCGGVLSMGFELDFEKRTSGLNLDEQNSKKEEKKEHRYKDEKLSV
jgi:hypothetical protein